MSSYESQVAANEVDAELSTGYSATDTVFGRPISDLQITDVPDITAGASLNNQNFDTTLSAGLQKWFEEFIEIYNTREHLLKCREDFVAVLLNDPQPYTLALKFFALWPADIDVKRNSILSFVFECIFDAASEKPEIIDTCTDNDRMVAFNFAKLCDNQKFHETVANKLKLNQITAFILPKLKEMLLKYEYKSVVEWSIILGITNSFKVHDIVLPLVFQRNLTLLYEYLKYAGDLQIPAVQYLDTLITGRYKFIKKCEELIEKYNYKNIDKSILNLEAMTKFLARLAKKFQIEFEYAPNLMQSRSVAYLRYLYRKYSKGEMTLEAWRELAVEEASKSQQTVWCLVHMITCNNDIDEAIYWVNLFRIPPSRCPTNFQLKMKNGIDTNSPSIKRNTNNNYKEENLFSNCAAPVISHNKNMEFLSLKLPKENIIFVDHMGEFKRMVKYLEKHSRVAFDSEWKSAVTINKMALLQLATNDRVYLVDCLSHRLDYDAWKLLANKIFNNLQIIKIGFSLDNDLEMMQKLMPLDVEDACSSYLDLRVLWRRLKYIQAYDIMFKNSSASGEKLSNLTEICLGKTLNKIYQISKWDKRPLRQEQIVYAALDAHCLLDIYRVIEEKLKEFDLTMEYVMDRMNLAQLRFIFAMRQSDQYYFFDKQDADNRRMLNIHIKFVADMKMFDLTSELRKLGIDCLQIMNDYQSVKYTRLAKRENRYILCTNSRRSFFSEDLPKNALISVPCDTIENQVIHVLQNFKHNFDFNNFYSRCLKCNSNEFILATFEDMKFMLRNRTNQPQANNNGFADYPEYPMYYERQNDPLKNRILIPITDDVLNSKRTFCGWPIQLNRKIFNAPSNITEFYICNNCGCSTYEYERKIPITIMNYLRENHDKHETVNYSNQQESIAGQNAN